MANRMVMREEMLYYLDVGTTAAPSLKLMGDGFLTAGMALNPTAYSRSYVNLPVTVSDTTGYAPAISYTGDIYSEDEAIKFVTDAGLNRETGKRANIVEVYTWIAGTKTGFYKALKYPVSVNPSTYGANSGGSTLDFAGSLNAVGEGITGEFDPVDKKFYTDAEVTTLA
jgi:hypothetical protein